MLEAVLWDFGGVILSSPFEAFSHFEVGRGLPTNFLRTVNATNPHTNAWARLERSDIDASEFDEAFAADSTALGHPVRGADVLALLAGEVRPEMVAALDAVKAAGYRTACLTNNVVAGEGHGPVVTSVEARDRADLIARIMDRFDAVIESSKIGVRKPEPRFYEIACETLGVKPGACVFLDDLGVNLKPAAAMGMRTIKVLSAGQALAELGEILDLRF
jgi:putative hydrolase of the HAD superfamily